VARGRNGLEGSHANRTSRRTLGLGEVAVLIMSARQCRESPSIVEQAEWRASLVQRGCPAYRAT
jgi:hypothetical protein